MLAETLLYIGRFVRFRRTDDYTVMWGKVIPYETRIALSPMYLLRHAAYVESTMAFYHAFVVQWA